MTRGITLCIAALILLRAIAAAALPLSADEAYYWLWSKHLAAGYYDHPPMIAWAIRLGTIVFGNTAFGVRVVPVLLSVAASWFVWRAGTILTGDERKGALACLFFNLTLMTAVETMAATPDAPLIVTSAAFLFALARLDETQDARWWLAVGAAGGAALLSKYTGFFLGVGALAWMVFTPTARRWLLSPWPYLGALLALLIFLPNIWWNATHSWATFTFQFGRVGAGHFTLRYLVEFLGAQLLLASPLILVCAVLGMPRSAAIVSAAILPAALYFAVHSLHDRVQGNWPCFLYPALAIAAVTMGEGWLKRLAAPVAGVILIACYAQMFFNVVPLGRGDPGSRLLGYGMADVASRIENEGNGPAAILTTDYATTAWFAFYGHLPVIPIGEEQRWLDYPRPDARLLNGPLVYVAEPARDRHGLVAGAFASLTLMPPVERARGGRAVARYDLYRVEGPRELPLGRMP